MEVNNERYKSALQKKMSRHVKVLSQSRAFAVSWLGHKKNFF